MNNSEKLVKNLILSSAVNEKYAKLKFHDVVKIRDKEGNVVYSCIKAPAFNPVTIGEQGIINIGDLRKMFNIDEDETNLELSISNRRRSFDGISYDEISDNIEIMDIEIEAAFKASLGMTANDVLKLIESPTVTMQDSGVVISYELAQDFFNLGDTQRALPEIAMLDYQKICSGVMSNAVEHCGDLIHRCTHMMVYGRSGYEETRPKVKRLLESLSHKYGFLREHEENIVSNYHCTYGDNHEYSEEQFRTDIDSKLKKYELEHSKLPAYNKLHLACKRASVALARKDIPVAISSLKEIEDMLSSHEKFAKCCTEHVLKNGKPLDISAKDEYLANLYHNKKESIKDIEPSL